RLTPARAGSARGTHAVEEQVRAVRDADDGAARVAEVLVQVPVEVREHRRTARFGRGDDVAAGAGEVDDVLRGHRVLPLVHAALHQLEPGADGGQEVLAADVAGVHDPGEPVDPGDGNVEHVP